MLLHPTFYGEVGVFRRMPRVPKHAGWLDSEYDHDNPDGSEYSRRNYAESSYLSGCPDLVPAEYAWKVGRYYGDFSVGSPSDPEHPVARPQGS